MTAEPKRGGGPRLLWIHQNFVTARQAGNSRPIHLVAALLGQGWSVDVVTTQRGYLDAAAGRPTRPVLVEREGCLTIHRLRTAAAGTGLRQRSRAHLEFLAQAVRYAWRVRGVDVLYASTPPLLQTLAPVALSAVRGIPLVLEVRDLWPAFLVETGLLKSPLLTRVLEWLECFLYRYADHCIAVAPAFVPYLQALGASAQELTVVPTGADPLWARAPRDLGARWRREQALEGRFVVVYAGSFQEYYGLDTVLAAARQLATTRPEIVWVFAGAGRDVGQVERAAAELGCVRYLGSLPRDGLAPLYQAADAGLVTLRPVPLFDTVIPGKLLDYLACGLPVVSLVSGQAGALVRAAGAGVVVEDPTPAGLAAAVSALADLPAPARAGLGEQGRQWALRHMSATDLAQDAAQLLGRLTAPRGRLACLARALGASLAAVRDLIRRKPTEASARYYGRRRAETVEGHFQTWLDGRAAAAGRPRPPAPPMPALLSERA
jgi:glycosyltransferase involved in cell wall biosynthesis